MGGGGAITHTQQDLMVYSVHHKKLNIIFYQQSKTFLQFFFTFFRKKIPNASTLERNPSDNEFRVLEAAALV